MDEFDAGVDSDRDGIPDVIDADYAPPGAFGSPAATSWDVDADGIPDSIDASVDVAHEPEPAHLDVPFSPEELEMLGGISDPEQRALMELQMRQQRQGSVTSTLTNISNMKHESLKGIANNLRG